MQPVPDALKWRFSKQRPAGCGFGRALGLLVTLGVAAQANAERRAWDWLGEAALKAKQAHNYGRAVSLLRGAAALSGEHPEVLFALADTYELAGQADEAVDAYARFLEVAPADDPRRARAQSEHVRLKSIVAAQLNPFVDAVFKPAPATEEAKRAFAEGQKLLRGNKANEAIVLFETAAFLDPDLPGPYRVLGGLYGKIGQPRKKIAFLTRYLQVKPEGPIAEAVRRDLRQSGAPLGKLNLQTTHPCLIEINGRPIGRKTPLRSLELPEGRYYVTFDCSERWHLERHARAELKAGKETTKEFHFGIIKPELSPWARVRVDGRDQGLWEEIALPEGKHHLELRAHDGSHEKEVDVEVIAGKTIRIDKW
jgi:tetratricopeptide (TPR) repeat protein